MSRILPLTALGAAALLAACGYAPPPRTDTAAPRYQADLDACETAVPAAVNRTNAKTGLAWFSSPVRRWFQIDDGVSDCMAGKGWGRVRACTAEELRRGDRNASTVVTASGVRCADPGRPS